MTTATIVTVGSLKAGDVLKDNFGRTALVIEAVADATGVALSLVYTLPDGTVCATSRPLWMSNSATVRRVDRASQTN